MNGEDVTEAFDWPVARRRLFWAGGLAHPQYIAASPPPTARRMRVAAHTQDASVRFVAYTKYYYYLFSEISQILNSKLSCFFAIIFVIYYSESNK